MKQFTSKPLLVRYGETDQMGVVHHSNYLRYFEVARLEWLSALGVSYASMEKEGLIMPVIDIKATYKTPALFDDSLTIYVFLSELPRVKIIFLYEIKNQKDEIVCTGETTLAFLNAKTRKPVRCPEEFGALFIT
ncbi:MAG: acyl-CoA thioester hydrolase [Flavobacteriales bacterium]|jgi:acyl-CoA thioester hydrolase|tara:strand:+ start:3954 stop:4355 length:402 start_codon:yes stop_codon:yes gene_type:complete